MAYVETLFEGASDKNLQLANKLISETGITDADLFPWFARFYFNPNVKTPEMTIRTVIRETLLKKMGYDSEEGSPDPSLGGGVIDIRDTNDRRILNGKFSTAHSRILNTLIGKPSYQAYDWTSITIWRLGDFKKLSEENKNKGFLAIPKCGVILFDDELKKLASREAVMAFHGAGIEGFLMETKVVYKLVDNDLIKVVANLID